VNGDIITPSGNFYCMDDEPISGLEYGWWTNSESNGSGTFTSPETIEVTFDSRPANEIKVVTSYSLGRVATGVLSYKNTADVWISHNVTFGVDDYEYVWDLISNIYIKGLRFQINSTRHPVDVGRIHELVPLYTETFDGDDIVTFNVEKMREGTDLTSPIGNTAANTFSVTFDNTDKNWNPDGSGLWSDFIEPDIIIRPYLGWGLDNDVFPDEYVPIGEYFADTADISDGMEATFQCRDYSKYLQEQNVADGIFNEDETVGLAIADAAKTGGVPNRKINFNEHYWKTLSKMRPMAAYTLQDSPPIDEAEDYEDLVIDDFMLDNDGALVVTTASDIEMGAPSIIPSSKVTCAKFNGISGKYISIPNDADLTYSGEFTITGAFKVESFPGSGSDIIIAKQSGTAANYLLQVNSGGTVSASVRNTANTSSSVATSGTLVANTTYTFAMWWDASDSKTHLMINDTEYEASSTINAPNQTSAVVTIGGWTSTGYEFDGWIQGIALFDRKLRPEEIDTLYVEAFIEEVYRFPYLYILDQTLWEGMLEWATADLGVFYFDEYGFLNYDYRNTLHDQNLTRHSTPQYEFSDSTNIVSGSRIADVQSNRVIVTVNPITGINDDVQSIWAAEEGESLVVTKAREGLQVGEEMEFKVQSTENPVWKDKGYFKIDDEIVGYSSKTGNKFLELERGAFGTTPAAHFSRPYTFEDNLHGFQVVRNCHLRKSGSRSYAGDYSLRVRCDPSNGDLEDFNAILTGRPGNRAIPSSFEVKTINMKIYCETAARNIKVGIRTYNKQGDIVSTFYEPLIPGTLDGWQLYTVSYQPSGNEKYFTPIVYFADVVDEDIFFIDQVDVNLNRPRVREVRYYDIEYDQAPAIRVKAPHISAVIFDEEATIESFEHDHFTAQVLVSANDNVPVGGTVVLEGTNPLTEEENYFRIAGVPLVEESDADQVKEEPTSSTVNTIPGLPPALP